MSHSRLVAYGIAWLAFVSLFLGGRVLLASDLEYERHSSGIHELRRRSFPSGDASRIIPQNSLRATFEATTSGRSITVSGQLLMSHTDKQADYVPVSWFQPVTVLISPTCDLALDNTTRHNSQFPEHAIRVDTIVDDRDGRFTISVEPEKLVRSPGRTHSYKIGIRLGRHVGQTVIWPKVTSVAETAVGRIRIAGPPTIPYAFELINASPAAEDTDFDPTSLIRAVNYLQGLGKVRAIEALREYLDAARHGSFRDGPKDPTNLDYANRNNVYLIVRLLFEPTRAEEGYPEIKCGLFRPTKPVGAGPLWRRYPLLVQNDIPFLIASPALVLGMSQDPVEHVDWADRHAIMRTAPLIPTEDPIVAMQLLCKYEEIRQSPRCQRWLLAQAVTAMGEHSWTASLDRGSATPIPSVDEIFRSAKARACHWNERLQRFEIADPKSEITLPSTSRK